MKRLKPHMGIVFFFFLNTSTIQNVLRGKIHSSQEKSIGYRWAAVLAEPTQLVCNRTMHLLPWQPEEGLLSLTPAGHFML